MHQDSSDVAKYECYAQAFWHGGHALSQLPAQQCSFLLIPPSSQPAITQQALLSYLQNHPFPLFITHIVSTQIPLQPFHTLPYEYPFLALLFFLPGLLVPAGWYQLSFAIGMLVISIFLYGMLRLIKNRRVALTYACYLTVGGWATALGRFDLIPAICTFLTLIFAERRQWGWSSFFLALATMLKFYPIVFLPLLLIVQFRTQRSLRVLLPLGIFIVTCLILTIVSLLFSVTDTLAPLTYFSNRPVQIESVSASIIWLSSLITRLTPQYTYSFGSHNIINPTAPLVSHMATILFITGLLYVYWLQWQRYLPLAFTMLLTLLIVVVTGKVFSAQYLLWILPFVAYVGAAKKQWVMGWGCISILTVLIYPFIYNRGMYPFGNLLPDLYLAICIRNAFLLGFTLFLLIQASKTRTKSIPNA
ncbi:MAG TPA: glycosyltransferase family 87 protein [Dictyobacter sp.]|nr:glycosyltransferase family 87 protein [Dictyobacter sp.]